MKKYSDYKEKFQSFRNRTFYEKLESGQQEFIYKISNRFRLTFQEFRQVVEACRDLSMWGEKDLQEWWMEQEAEDISEKKMIIGKMHTYLDQLKNQEKVYPQTDYFVPEKRIPLKIISEKSDKKIHGRCPVASEKTVCCNLHTIDAVENCVYGCSYCTIQTFYGNDIIIQEDVRDRLKQITVEPDRFYHFGTGQSSDSLVWGNRNGILDAHCDFAAEHPNILMEFKTKSDNISYFLNNKIPDNVVCSWSLNTPSIIKNEEHFTPSLDQRLEAARKVAEKGIKIAFHFHPLVWYAGWADSYGKIASTLIENFNPAQILFISFGSVTLIKPVVRKIRELGKPTKTLQMQLVPDPHGRLTYPDETKIAMFRHMYQAFERWHGKVFFYLCMEKADIWTRSLGYVYKNNEEFEQDLFRQSMAKICPE